MRQHIEEVNKLLPIFHQGEDFKWLRNMLEYKDSEGKHIEYIGISPANDSHINGKIAFMDKVFKIIGNSSNPNVKTHAFGMTSLYLLERYPFWSADSAGWVKKAAYGFVYIPKPNIVPGEISYTLIGFGTRTNSLDHFVNQDDITKKYIREYIESIGYKLLSSEYKNSQSKLHMICDKNHDIHMTYNAIRQGKRCNVCARKEQGRKKILSYEYVKNEIEKDKENLVDLYVNKNKSIKNLADKYNLPELTISNFLNSLGIKTHRDKIKK